MTSCMYTAWGDFDCRKNSRSINVEGYRELPDNSLHSVWNKNECIDNTGSSLYPGDYILSSDKRYKLIYQTDGNLVVYDKTTPVWSAGKLDSNPKCAVMQHDGNFVLYNKTGSYWATNTMGKGRPPFRVTMQRDRNLALYDSTNFPQWNSQTNVAVTGTCTTTNC